MSVGMAVADTDVVSYLFKGDTRRVPYETMLASYSPFISFMTLAELKYWSMAARWGMARIDQLELFLQQFGVIPPDHELCEKWAEVTLACRRAGRPIQTADAWIAATAIQLNAPLFTHNGADFAAVPGLTIISATP